MLGKIIFQCTFRWVSVIPQCNGVFAGIAMEAINYARHARIDVVLVDTAGRMQDNEPLMRALAKLISGTTTT